MKYTKGDFTLVPNKEALRGLDPQTQVLFMWLCAYADDNGICYPSISKLQEDTGMSNRTVIRRLETLENKNMIQRQHRIKNGAKTSNIYQIMLVEQEGSDTQAPGVVTHRHHPSDTQTHRTITNKLYPSKLYISEQCSQEEKPPKKQNVYSKEGAEVIKAFEPINPAAKKWYGNKTQRAAADRLLLLTNDNGEPFGLDNICKVIAALQHTNEMPYFPVITTPYQLEIKWAQLRSIWKRKKQEQEASEIKIADFS